MKIACAAGTMAFLCGVTAFAAPEKTPKEWGRKLVWRQTAEVMSRPGILSAANMTDGGLWTPPEGTNAMVVRFHFRAIATAPI